MDKNKLIDNLFNYFNSFKNKNVFIKIEYSNKENQFYFNCCDNTIYDLVSNIYNMVINNSYFKIVIQEEKNIKNQTKTFFCCFDYFKDEFNYYTKQDTKSNILKGKSNTEQWLFKNFETIFI
jgi:hypothetical protein